MPTKEQIDSMVKDLQDATEFKIAKLESLSVEKKHYGSDKDLAAYKNALNILSSSGFKSKLESTEQDPNPYNQATSALITINPSLITMENLDKISRLKEKDISGISKGLDEAKGSIKGKGHTQIFKQEHFEKLIDHDANKEIVLKSIHKLLSKQDVSDTLTTTHGQRGHVINQVLNVENTKSQTANARLSDTNDALNSINLPNGEHALKDNEYIDFTKAILKSGSDLGQAINNAGSIESKPEVTKQMIKGLVDSTNKGSSPSDLAGLYQTVAARSEQFSEKEFGNKYFTSQTVGEIIQVYNTNKTTDKSQPIIEKLLDKKESSIQSKNQHKQQQREQGISGSIFSESITESFEFTPDSNSSQSTESAASSVGPDSSTEAPSIASTSKAGRGIKAAQESRPEPLGPSDKLRERRAQRAIKARNAENEEMAAAITKSEQKPVEPNAEAPTSTTNQAIPTSKQDLKDLVAKAREMVATNTSEPTPHSREDVKELIQKAKQSSPSEKSAVKAELEAKAKELRQDLSKQMDKIQQQADSKTEASSPTTKEPEQQKAQTAEPRRQARVTQGKHNFLKPRKIGESGAEAAGSINKERLDDTDLMSSAEMNAKTEPTSVKSTVTSLRELTQQAQSITPSSENNEQNKQEAKQESKDSKRSGPGKR